MSESGMNLTHARFRSLPTLVPPLNEQRRIANKLDALLARVDACRDRLDRLDRLPAILKRFRRSVLAAATSGELTADWRAQRGASVEGWGRAELGEIVERVEAGLNVQCDERPPQVNERGLVKISAVTWGTYNEGQSKTLRAGTAVPEAARIRG